MARFYQCLTIMCVAMAPHKDCSSLIFGAKIGCHQQNWLCIKKCTFLVFFRWNGHVVLFILEIYTKFYICDICERNSTWINVWQTIQWNWRHKSIFQMHTVHCESGRKVFRHVNLSPSQNTDKLPSRNTDKLHNQSFQTARKQPHESIDSCNHHKLLIWRVPPVQVDLHIWGESRLKKKSTKWRL